MCRRISFPVSSSAVHEGYHTEDLARQTFPDESFDLVITSDVLEHLPEARESMIEVARTLKTGGVHIFTVPWYKEKGTLVRAKLVSGEMVHLEEPDYHGNPVSADGSLVITEWGREFPSLLAGWVNLPVSVFHLKDRKKGLDGEFIEVFSFRKPG